LHKKNTAEAQRRFARQVEEMRRAEANSPCNRYKKVVLLRNLIWEMWNEREWRHMPSDAYVDHCKAPVIRLGMKLGEALDRAGRTPEEIASWTADLSYNFDGHPRVTGQKALDRHRQYWKKVCVDEPHPNMKSSFYWWHDFNPESELLALQRDLNGKTGKLTKEQAFLYCLMVPNQNRVDWFFEQLLNGERQKKDVNWDIRREDYSQYRDKRWETSR
jgi:hypothetical protein